MREATASENVLKGIEGDVQTAMASHAHGALELTAPEQLVQLCVAYWQTELQAHVWWVHAWDGGLILRPPHHLFFALLSWTADIPADANCVFAAAQRTKLTARTAAYEFSM